MELIQTLQAKLSDVGCSSQWRTWPIVVVGGDAIRFFVECEADLKAGTLKTEIEPAGTTEEA
jgi:hypothetical protein